MWPAITTWLATHTLADFIALRDKFTASYTVRHGSKELGYDIRFALCRSHNENANCMAAYGLHDGYEARFMSNANVGRHACTNVTYEQGCKQVHD